MLLFGKPRVHWQLETLRRGLQGIREIMAKPIVRWLEMARHDSAPGRHASLVEQVHQFVSPDRSISAQADLVTLPVRLQASGDVRRRKPRHTFQAIEIELSDPSAKMASARP